MQSKAAHKDEFSRGMEFYKEAKLGLSTPRTPVLMNSIRFETDDLVY